jgi:hypothetical protein
MNVGRGLFRAWILISILWIIGAGVMGYVIESPDTVHGSFQPDFMAKGGLEWWQVDYSKSFYETMRSPSAEKLNVTFHPIDWQTKNNFDKDAKMDQLLMDDGSTVYVHAEYSEADKDYIAKQFWNQRWNRYGYAAGIVALWAFVPCALLFILGYALLWVGRGFTRV